MPYDSIIWDLDDDPAGNVQHCAEHGVSKEEVEEVFENATDADVSRSSGRPVVFGDTSTGRHLMVVFDEMTLSHGGPLHSGHFGGRNTAK
jgi:uncharacterized DUF497 family protein